MSLLTERLPCEVVVTGQPFQVDPDFRLMVELESLVFREQSEAVADELAGLLSHFYCGSLPGDAEAAVDAMLYFYRCGKDDCEDGQASHAKRVYDFEQDAEALYTSFLQAYQLDLTTAAVHWWQFRRLMFGLPSETPFSRRLYYRTADTSGMGKEERRRHNKFRALYAIREHVAGKETLEARNARMKAYVDRRFSEVSNGSDEEN